jgi:nucleobase transporter 1/2
MQSTGTLIAVSRYSGATFTPPSVFSRGVGWEVIKSNNPKVQFF